MAKKKKPSPDPEEVYSTLLELLKDPDNWGSILDRMMVLYGFANRSAASRFIESKIRPRHPEFPSLVQITNRARRKDFHRRVDYWRRQLLGIEEDDLAAQAFFEDKKGKERIDWRELVAHAIESAGIKEKLDDYQKIGRVKIKTRSPIAVMFTGDWHLGDRYTDHARWLKDMEFILSSEDLFIVDLGDDRQNARSFKNLSLMLRQVLSPKEQAHLVRGLVDELTAKRKLLAKVAANHDVEWDERIFGEALQGYLLERMEAPHFRNRGLLFLTVGSQDYRLLLFHKSRFRSFLRPAHGAFREHQLSYPADVVAGGHDHLPAFELLPYYTLAETAGETFGGFAYLLKVGTYQEDKEYSWAYYHNGGLIYTPTVVFWPDEKKMQVFFDPRDAVAFLGQFKGGKSNADNPSVSYRR